MASIKDVARHAGVSTATVSRVINQRSVSPATRRRVLAAMEKLDYRVNRAAQGLVRRHTNAVGVIVADAGNPTMGAFVAGVSAILHAEKLHVVLGNSDYSRRRELDLLKVFEDQRMRGVIFTGEGVDDALTDRINTFPSPIVVASQDHPRLKCPVAYFNNYQAARDVVVHLAESGHREIGFISCPLEDPQAGEMRWRGYHDAMADADLPVRDGYVQQAGDFTIEAGYRAAADLLDSTLSQNLRPTVIFAASDRVAIGATRLLRDRGIRVPRDIGIFGFDNIPVGEKLVPSLSSVFLDFSELGEVAATMLVHRLRRSSSQVRKVILTHTMIPRESSAYGNA
jgi:LacI family transcriptional regulator